MRGTNCLKFFPILLFVDAFRVLKLRNFTSILAISGQRTGTNARPIVHLAMNQQWEHELSYENFYMFNLAKGLR